MDEGGDSVIKRKDNIEIELEWNGKTFRFKYDFTVARRLRAETGINFVGVCRKVQAEPQSAIDYGDEVAETIAFMLREAGAEGVTGEDVWRYAMSSEEGVRVVFAAFHWLSGQHFAGSEVTPVPKATPAKKPAKRSQKKTSS